MRSLVIAASLLTITACSSGEVGLTPLGNLNGDVAGLVFDGDDSAQAGMSGATCQVDPDSGDIGEDVDVAENDDQVVDAEGDFVLVLGDDGLHLYDPASGPPDEFWVGEDEWTPDPPDVPGTDLVDGQLLTDGRIVAVRDGNGVSSTLWPDGSVVDLPGRITGDLDADPDGVLLASVDGAVLAVTEAGWTPFAIGDLVSWDRDRGAAWVATRWDTSVRLVDSQATLLQVVSVDGPVQDLTALADGFAVVTGGYRGGELRRYDSAGLELGHKALRDVDAELIASPGGSTLAVRMGQRTQFFAVRE